MAILPFYASETFKILFKPFVRELLLFYEKHSEAKTSKYITLPKINVCINKTYSFCFCFLNPLFAII